MANPEHVEIIKKGVEKWNKWREKNPDVRPDISGTDLSEANLTRVDLSGADLNNAKLSGAIFNRANLSQEMGKEWFEMSRKELEDGFLSGTLHAAGGQGKQALQRLRMLWRKEDSKLAWIAITLAGLTFLVSLGWLIWTIFVWTHGSLSAEKQFGVFRSQH